MELPRDYLIQPVAMLRNAGREPAGLPVVIKSEQRSQSRRNAGRNRPEYADHLFVSPDLGVDSIQIPRTKLTRVASDHLPLVVKLHAVGAGSAPQ